MMELVDGSKPFKVAMPDGVIYLVQPGKRKRGIQVEAFEDAARSIRRSAGRPPSEATALLRARLHDDIDAGDLLAPGDYVSWLLGQGAGPGLEGARSLVYRELRKARKELGVAGPRGPGGPRPRPVTLELRKMLERDANKNRLKESKHYTQFVLSKEPGLSRAAAAQMVYRERQKVS